MGLSPGSRVEMVEVPGQIPAEVRIQAPELVDCCDLACDKDTKVPKTDEFLCDVCKTHYSHKACKKCHNKTTDERMTGSDAQKNRNASQDESESLRSNLNEVRSVRSNLDEQLLTESVPQDNSDSHSDSDSEASDAADESTFSSGPSRRRTRGHQTNASNTGSSQSNTRPKRAAKRAASISETPTKKKR